MYIQTVCNDQSFSTNKDDAPLTHIIKRRTKNPHVKMEYRTKYNYNVHYPERENNCVAYEITPSAVLAWKFSPRTQREGMRLTPASWNLRSPRTSSRQTQLGCAWLREKLESILVKVKE